MHHLVKYMCTLGGKPLYNEEKDKFTFSPSTECVVLNDRWPNQLKCGNCMEKQTKLPNLVRHYNKEHKWDELMKEPLIMCYVCELNHRIYAFSNHFSKHGTHCPRWQ